MPTGEAGRVWRVGELAARTGLTVRALHHYDAVGLLSPSGRTAAGHRLYTAADLARLQQVLSLKQLGFGLDEVREYLTRADYDPRRVVRLHLGRVRGQAAELQRLADRLGALADALDRAEVVSADDFLNTVREITVAERYYTPGQLDQLAARKEQVGPARIEEVQAEWPKLFAAVRAELDAGTPPTDPKAQALARRWFGLVAEFTGGDPGVFKSLKTMYQNEDTIHGMDVRAMRPMMAYIEQAADAAGVESGPGAPAPGY